MKALHQYGCWLLLPLCLLANGQVLVFSGKTQVVAVGGGAYAKASVPMVLILDLSATRDPGDFVTVLPVLRDERLIDCRNYSSVLRTLTARGSKGKDTVALLWDGFELGEPTARLTEWFMLTGSVSPLALGPHVPPLAFAKTLAGKGNSLELEPLPSGNHLWQGSFNLRLQTSESKLANTPVAGGAPPSYQATVLRQKTLLGKKYKYPIAAVCE